MWFNVLNATAAVILSAPPYNFGSSAIGVAYVAPLIGVLLGYFLSRLRLIEAVCGPGKLVTFYVSNSLDGTVVFENLSNVSGCSYSIYFSCLPV
jgi:hypothetical protein